MKIKFTKDFANNWRAGDVVDGKYIGHGDVLVDNVARIDLNLLIKHCVILSEYKDNKESKE